MEEQQWKWIEQRVCAEGPRCISKFVLCFTSYGSWNSKSDLRSHSRALAMVPFVRPIRFPISLPFCNYVSILHYFRDIIAYFLKFKEVKWLWGHVTLNTSLLGVIYHACTRTPLYQYAKFKCLVSQIRKIWLGQNLKNTGQVTLTTPLLGVVCHCSLGFDTVCLRAKFDDSSFSHPGDIVGASKFKVGHMTVTTPLLRLIFHPYAGTWLSLQCTRMQNLTTLASAVPEIRLVPTKI